MSSPAPIGAFDSGVGGLSILIEVRKLLPNEDLIYLADSAHCPYGVKPLEEIQRRSLEVTDYLVSFGIKALVVACNTACVAGLEQVREKYAGLPVIGVEPAVKPAHEVTKNGKIGVLATQLTLNGDRFTHLVERYGAGVEVLTQPAPGLVELVEAGKIDSPETEAVLTRYLEPLLKNEVDTLVLGCTHYPFLRPLIQKICGPGVAIIDTGKAVAAQTRRVLENKGILNPAAQPGREIFYTTGDPEEITKTINKLWPKGPGIHSMSVFKAEV
ncbi:MAG: glutamate racemase [Firmicutes bacterium]|nr:glutamate racemase [Bacillota bacterium]